MSRLSIGDPVPWFVLPSTSNPTFNFDTVGGYRVVLFFFGSARVARSAEILRDFLQRQHQFAALHVPFFGVSIDAEDMGLKQAIENPTFCKFLWDFARQVSIQYGVCQVEGEAAYYAPTTFVLDENLRVLQVFPVESSVGYVEQVLTFLERLPPQEPPRFATRQAPVLFIPHVFEPEFCQDLINLYNANGGEASGFMREVDGKTVAVLDRSFKQRKDFLLEDPALLERVNAIVLRRIKPEIAKVFQFDITRFERHLIACYEDTSQGFFNRHRDNTTKGTAHRRFAMTLNLNTGDYEGGCLLFPEYGTQLYRPETGEAVIFSCSLAHEVTPVTIGKRYVLLSFFYGDADAQLRERNRKYLDQENTPADRTGRTEEDGARREERTRENAPAHQDDVV